MHARFRSVALHCTSMLAHVNSRVVLVHSWRRTPRAWACPWTPTCMPNWGGLQNAQIIREGGYLRRRETVCIPLHSDKWQLLYLKTEMALLTSPALVERTLGPFRVGGNPCW